MPPLTAQAWQKAFEQVQARVSDELPRAQGLDAVEALRVKVVGRAGELTLLLRQLKDLPLDERKRLGPEANRLREEVEAKLDAAKAELERRAGEASLLAVREDLTLPARPRPRGALHPVTLVMDRMAGILARMGFAWADGPLVETDWYNFEALNIPKEHPARDLQDTYYLERAPGAESRLLRTHTSPVQIRTLERLKPPVRIMAPGRVFRHEAVDATHSHVFHQVEGLYVDRKVSMADLKGTLFEFLKALFGDVSAVRFTPSYFPFVEPGVQVGMTWTDEKGREEYLELLGAGLVHPSVLKAAGHDPSKVSGFAFGIGVERVAMRLFGVSDIRQFYENDVRFLSQFA